MKYFTIEELCNSQTAKKLGIENKPDPIQEHNLTRLIEELLDPLREAWGSPIQVSSGFRGFRLNKNVGGSTTSAHCIGAAADLVPIGRKMPEFKRFVMNWLIKNQIKFDQYIDEKSGNSEWVHLGLINKSGAQRKQFLMYRNKTYVSINPKDVL